MARMTIDEQIKAAQERVAALKKKQAKERERKVAKVGQAVVDRFPELLDMMETDGFNIFEYVATKEFAQQVIGAWKRDNPQTTAQQ